MANSLKDFHTLIELFLDFNSDKRSVKNIVQFPFVDKYLYDWAGTEICFCCVDFSDSVKKIVNSPYLINGDEFLNKHVYIFIINNVGSEKITNRFKLSILFEHFFSNSSTASHVVVVWTGNPNLSISNHALSYVDEMFFASPAEQDLTPFRLTRLVQSYSFSSIKDQVYSHIDLVLNQKNTINSMYNKSKLDFFVPDMVHQRFYELINALSFVGKDDLLHKLCMDIRQKFNDTLLGKYPNKNCFECQTLRHVFKENDDDCSFFILHFTPYLSCNIDHCIFTFRKAEKSGLPILFFDWSNSDDSQTIQNEELRFQLKYHLFHLKSPVFYFLMGHVSLHTFVSHNISNYSFVHQYASVFLTENNQRLYACDLRDKGYIDKIISYSYEDLFHLNNFEDSRQSFLKEFLAVCKECLIQNKTQLYRLNRSKKLNKKVESHFQQSKGVFL